MRLNFSYAFTLSNEYATACWNDANKIHNNIYHNHTILKLYAK